MKDTRTGLRWIAGDATPDQVYMTRVFNFGTWQEWQAMRNTYSLEQIKRVVLNPLPGS